MWPIPPVPHYPMGGRGDGQWGNSVQGVWGTGGMDHGAYGQWGTGGMGSRGMGPMGNGAQGVWGTRGMGHMGNGVQGVWGVWAMRPTGGYGYRGMGNGIQKYGPHGQWGPKGIYSQNIKKMSSCQKDVKLSKRCQMSKNETPRLWRRFTKKLNWHNEVHRYWRQFWRNKWWSLKTLKMFIESIFGQFWWPSYLTSKFTSICVNLIKSIFFFLWTSSIVQMFDFFTFDIFLTTWHFDT